MRFLSKVIFIHSANIPYAEVKVDGNVHFSGTQGVGKSTILRAILFFYNADPARLGIRVQGQKKFDQFYFPHSNSYIIFEVERTGDRPFCVIVTRQNARAIYRFADGPFSKEWFIDENGIVTGDIHEVRRRVQKTGTDVSNIVDSYTDYRDIIYGNRHAKIQHAFERYHLMASSKYENLPRIITNVFLNERVDADFIKETIIQSMGEDEPTVKLKVYSEQLKNLSEIFHDTRLWTRPNRKGEIETLEKAKRVIEKGNEVIANSSYLRELCAYLNFVFPEAEKRIPLLKIELDALYSRLGKLSEKKDSLANAHEKERNKVTMALGGIGENIRKAEKARKKYAGMEIEQKLRLDAEKPNHERERKILLSRISQLEQKAGDVAARFDRLVDEHRSTNLVFRRETEEKMVANQKKLNDDLALLRRETDNELDTLDENFRRKEETISERKEELSAEAHRLDLRLTETRHTRLHAQEIEALQRKLSSLEAEKKDIARAEEAIDHKIDSITNAIENDRLKIEEEFRMDISSKEREIELVKKEIEAENELLQSAKGSFVEWLDKNLDGWEETIGKVADEKNVLYNTLLSPSLEPFPSSSLFGVNIDLSNLKRNVRTPSEIRDHIEDLQQSSNKLKEQLKEKIELRDKEIAKSKTRRMADLNEAKKEKEGIRGRLLTLPQRISRTTDDLYALQRKTEDELAEALLKLEKEKEEVVRQLKSTQDNLNSIKDKFKAERKGIEKKRRDKEAALRVQTEELNSHLQQMMDKNARQTDEEIAKLNERKTEALKKEGVDTDILLSWRDKLAQTEAILTKIEENRSLIAVYLQEKREYIDRIEEFKLERESLLLKQGEMDEKFRQKANKLAQEINECNGAKEALKTTIQSLKDDIAETRRFIASPACPSYLKDMPPLASSDSCRSIIRNFYDTSERIHTGMEQLKNEINLFKQPFRQPAPFNFPTKLDSDKDYLAYAESVREFVEFDKIKDYQTTSNGIYKDILGRISRDYSTLAEREAEIHKVVLEVNADFAKKSFAGVIRKIELRLDRSESPVISTLQNIHEFWTRHGMEIGEANLFSFDEKDEANLQAVEWLKRLSEILEDNKSVDEIRLTDNFSLKLNVHENDNSTGWIDNMKKVGSDGTDILVKAIINILLINVFKKRIGKHKEPFALHCMMDEIGKLAEENIKGIVEFANARDIYIVNSAPSVHSPLSYRRIYMLKKDDNANTTIHPILSIRRKNISE